MEKKNHNILQPLMLQSSTSTSASPSNATKAIPTRLNDHQPVLSSFDIIMRLSLVVFIGMVSLWANHEASKGFAITIVNESRDTLAGKRFQLFYVSNDQVTRMVFYTSRAVENLLYSDSENRIKKRVDHVTIKLASQNLTDSIVVDTIKEGEFLLNISPSVMEGTNFGHVMFQVVQQGISHIWIWDGQGNAPKDLVNAIVEYISRKLGFPDIIFNSPRVASCNWKHDDNEVVADLLEHCERLRPGFIRRLNQEMKDEWHDKKLEIALGLPIQDLCVLSSASDSYLSTS